MPRRPAINTRRPSGKKHRSAHKGKKILLWILILFMAAGLFFAYKVFGPNTGSMTEGEYLYIRTGANYETVQKALNQGGFVRDLRSFNLLAERAGYPSRVRAGKYHIEKGMSNYEIVRLLRSGRQTPVRLVINKLRTKGDFIRLITRNLEADSNVLQRMFSDQVYLAQFGLDTNTAMCAIMPDTYEFFWNTNADQTFRKIAKNYAGFWTEDRKNAARLLKRSPQEVIIIASIVEEETNNTAEKPVIASVYLNRLKKRMKLQADPTARFAYGDFSIRRITGTHTSIASPYNTYYAFGLPPGPICTPSEKSILAVLNATETSYLYFCAKGDGSGTHLFATTYSDHLKNARAYQQHLNDSGIR